MSYNIELTCPVTGRTMELDENHHMRGGTYAVGGTRYAELNVTYNYSKYYYALIDADRGIRAIYGMTGAESIPILQKAADALKNDVDDDYWAGTEGNAKAALLQLIALAKMRPDGVWRGD